MVWDPTKPSDSESFGATPELLRNNWDALEDTIKIDHYEMTEVLEGQHRQVTLPETSTPSNIADTGIIYTKDVDDTTELFYEDNNANETQITNEGFIGGDKSFKILGIADGVDGAINGSADQNLYIITGDNVGVNKISFMSSSETITNSTQGNPCQITAVSHGLETGDEIRIIDVIGMTELNNANYTITYVDDDNFTLDGVDATLFTAYISGGRFCKEVAAFSSIPSISTALVQSSGTALKTYGNIDSVSRVTTGTYRIDFKTSYSSTNDYVLVGNAIITTADRVRDIIITEKNVAYVVYKVIDSGNNRQDNDSNVVIHSN